MPPYFCLDIKKEEFRNPMTRIWTFSCTASRFIVHPFFLILPYGFLRISSSASRNSDILISQWSLSPYPCFDIEKLEFWNLMTRIWAFFCTASRLIVLAFVVILPYSFLCISSYVARNSDILISKWILSPYLWFDIKKLEFRNLMTMIWAFFCTASHFIVPAFFVILPYSFLRI